MSMIQVDSPVIHPSYKLPFPKVAKERDSASADDPGYPAAMSNTARIRYKWETKHTTYCNILQDVVRYCKHLQLWDISRISNHQDIFRTFWNVFWVYVERFSRLIFDCSEIEGRGKAMKNGWQVRELRLTVQRWQRLRASKAMEVRHDLKQIMVPKKGIKTRINDDQWI